MCAVPLPWEPFLVAGIKPEPKLHFLQRGFPVYLALLIASSFELSHLPTDTGGLDPTMFCFVLFFLCYFRKLDCGLTIRWLCL